MLHPRAAMLTAGDALFLWGLWFFRGFVYFLERGSRKADVMIIVVTWKLCS